jgi:hypothetical protein
MLLYWPQFAQQRAEQERCEREYLRSLKWTDLQLFVYRHRINGIERRLGRYLQRKTK